MKIKRLSKERYSFLIHVLSSKKSSKKIRDPLSDDLLSIQDKNKLTLKVKVYRFQRTLMTDKINTRWSPYIVDKGVY